MSTMAGQVNEMDNMVSSLNEIQQDMSVPRNVRTKIESVVSALREDTEMQIKVNKALNELDEIVSDVNLQAYTRTQIWNVMSVLEKL